MRQKWQCEYEKKALSHTHHSIVRWKIKKNYGKKFCLFFLSLLLLLLLLFRSVLLAVSLYFAFTSKNFCIRFVFQLFCLCVCVLFVIGSLGSMAPGWCSCCLPIRAGSFYIPNDFFRYFSRTFVVFLYFYNFLFASHLFCRSSLFLSSIRCCFSLSFTLFLFNFKIYLVFFSLFQAWDSTFCSITQSSRLGHNIVS